MNYLKEVNAFHVWSMLHPEVSMSARILWYMLMHFNNIGFWQKTFSLSMDTLAAATGLSRAKLTEAHVVLQKAGRIRYMLCDGKKSAIYEIISMAGEGIQRTSEEKLCDKVQNKLPDKSQNDSCDIPKAKQRDEQQAGREMSNKMGKSEQQARLKSESQDERQSESRDGRIHRQDISKETTVKKGEVAKGKMKTEPKRCFTPPSVAMVSVGCEERIRCIVGQGIVTAVEDNRFMQRETREHEP